MIKNPPVFIISIAAKNQQTMREELRQSRLYRPKSRPPFSASMIRYTLHLWYKYLQAYKLVLKKFPMHPISLLNKIKQGAADPLITLKMLDDRGDILCYLVFMVDEMYLQKTTQYQGGEYVGTNEEGNAELQYSRLLDSSKSFHFLFKPYLSSCLPVNSFEQKLQRTMRTLLVLISMYVHLLRVIILRTLTH